MQTDYKYREIEKNVVWKEDNFQIKLNPAYVLRSIDCYPDSPIYEEVLEIYHEYYDVALEIGVPRAAVIVEGNDNRHGIKELENAEEIMYVCMTLGDDIGKKIEERFEVGEMLEGMVLEAIAVGMMFHIGNQTYKSIYRYIKNLGKGARHVVPGERRFELQYQQQVIKKVGKEIGVNVTSSMMLVPIKSSSSIYGIEEGIELSKTSHECKKCPDQTCKWRLAVYEG